MPCGWKGNRRSGVVLAMRHRLTDSQTSEVYPPTGSRLREGKIALRPHSAWGYGTYWHISFMFARFFQYYIHSDRCTFQKRTQYFGCAKSAFSRLNCLKFQLKLVSF